MTSFSKVTFTPHAAMHFAVRSMYGFERTVPDSLILKSCSMVGATIIRAEMNWLLTEFEIDTSPPVNRFPVIRKGG